MLFMTPNAPLDLSFENIYVCLLVQPPNMVTSIGIQYCQPLLILWHNYKLQSSSIDYACTDIKSDYV